MKPSNVQIKRIEKWIERRFHYLSYPDMTEESYWRDRTGLYHFMKDMSLDHLKACIRQVKNDIDEFCNGNMRYDMDFDIYQEYLVKPAKIKREELERAFNKKASE